MPEFTSEERIRVQGQEMSLSDNPMEAAKGRAIMTIMPSIMKFMDDERKREDYNGGATCWGLGSVFSAGLAAHIGGMWPPMSPDTQVELIDSFADMMKSDCAKSTLVNITMHLGGRETVDKMVAEMDAETSKIVNAGKGASS